MKNYILLLLSVLLILVSCSKTENIETDCLRDALEFYDMKEYAGEDLSGCRSSLTMVWYEGEQYFIVNTPCTFDILPYRDCSGNIVCSTLVPNPNFDCSEFYIGIHNSSIVGVSNE